MDGKLSQTLERLGLTQVETKVYLTLLENGSAQAGAITKLSGIHRRTVYDAIARLIEKGLITYIKSDNVKEYQATHPERLMELLKEQEAGLASQMGRLEELYETQPKRHETSFFRGKRGIKALFDDQLAQAGIEILIQGATPAAVDALRFYFPQFDRMRTKRGIKVKLLFDQRIKGKAYIKRIPLAQARILATAAPQDVVTCIYGDTVSIISFSEKPFGIMIREQTVADQHRNYFALLWASARRL